MSEVKVNKISPRSGTGVQLGDSGDTFTIPAGATITNSGTAVNFGATGSASWNTTVKTGDFTAVAGEGYFVNTTSGEIDVTLPASPSAGDVVAIKDYAETWDTNNCILLRNGSNIGGAALNSTLSTEGLAVTLVYIDATKGWLVTDSGLQSEVPTASFIAATGGTESIVCTNYKVHTFTGPGSFQVTSVGNAAGSNTVSYMVVAGGGGGGVKRGGGAGGGGFREGKSSQCSSWTASPLVAPAGLPVSVQTYTIEVGGGGTVGVGANPICNPASTANTNGVNSSFSTITSAGGAAGGGTGTPTGAGADGGSGGGGVHEMSGRPGPGANPGGAGNTPSVSPPQGTAGGQACQPEPAGTGGGGGGATVAGTNGGDGQSPGPGSGGGGATTNINGSPVSYSGGGGGGARPNGAQALGGTGGGGRGANCAPNPWGPVSQGENGTVNTGGGGGGTGDTPGANSGGGGSGIVIIRYKFQ
jgi:hypothetical protein